MAASFCFRLSAPLGLVAFTSIAMILGPVAGSADPSFQDKSQNLPFPHVYDGGWEHFVGGGLALFDCNEDGLTDIYAAGGENPTTLFVNTSEDGGEISFGSVTVSDIFGATGAYPIDINSDSYADLVVLRNGPNMLLKGNGDCTFEDATSLWGLDTGNRWSTAFSATWAPKTTFPTLAIGNYVDRNDPDGPFGTCDTNWLYQPEDYGFGPPIALEPGFCPLSMLFTDWQRSGTPMLRISNDRQYYVRDGYEQMWLLDPLRELTEDDGWPRLQLWGMGIASRDLSGDGLPEVMLTSMGDQVLMINEGNGFAAVPYGIGASAHRPFVGDDGRPSTGWHAEFGDIDNDGLPDLFIAKGNVDQMPGMAMQDPNNLLMQRLDGTFIELADVAGVASTARSRGAGLADLNNDGLLDIVVVNRRAPMEIWQNTSERAGNWLGIDLHQSGANSDAIGAFVTVRAAGLVQTQEVTIGGGHVSGSLIPRHFGIESAVIAEVQVTWPDKSVSPWIAVPTNQVVQLWKDF